MKAGRGRKYSMINWFLIAAAELLAVNLTAFFLLFWNPSAKWKKEKYDCAIICGYYANSDGTPSEMMKSRVDRGVRLWKEGKVQYLILSGGAVYNEYVEAEVMKDCAFKNGVPEKYMILERKAVSTHHNMMYSKEIMKRYGFRDCVAVTNGWHLRKADHYARRHGLDYVMCKAKNPKEQGIFESLWLYLKTDIDMYLKAFKGLY